MKKIVVGVCVVFGGVFVIGVSVYITSKYKDHVYKSLRKNHEKETAKKLSDEFNQKANQIRKEFLTEISSLRDSIKRLKEALNHLCEQFGVPLPSFA